MRRKTNFREAQQSGAKQTAAASVYLRTSYLLGHQSTTGGHRHNTRKGKVRRANTSLFFDLHFPPFPNHRRLERSHQTKPQVGGWETGKTKQSNVNRSIPGSVRPVRVFLRRVGCFVLFPFLSSLFCRLREPQIVLP